MVALKFHINLVDITTGIFIVAVIAVVVVVVVVVV
jgi:hypothetical protein